MSEERKLVVEGLKKKELSEKEFMELSDQMTVLKKQY